MTFEDFDRLPKPGDFYVAPNGCGEWSGLLPEPNDDGTDGPLASVEEARDRIRNLRKAEVSHPVTVWIRGGNYRLSTPLEFGPQDSGPAMYSGYPGEEPVFDGGIRVEGWKEEKLGETRVWTADVRDIIDTYGPWRSLFVEGRRRPRPRLPKTGYFWMEDVPGFDFDAQLFEGTDRFICRRGDIRQWRNLGDVEVIASHYWVDERMPIESFDEGTGLVVCSKTSIFNLEDSWNRRWSKYVVENVFEALGEPGEWYLDRREKKLYYVPIADETMDATEVTIPVVCQFLRLSGEPDGLPVKDLFFRNLTFKFSDWCQTEGWGRWYDPYTEPGRWRVKDSFRHFRGLPDSGKDYAAVPQGAFNVPGVLQLSWTQGCGIEGCRIEHIGFYGISAGEGCQSNRIAQNQISDMGAGGVILDGGDANSPMVRHNCRNHVTDNRIWDGGWIFTSAVGVISIHGYRQVISHNEIHDMGYSGISCGWVWGYGENISKENTIEYNHIYNLGRRGGLSDMGGIYTLGVQPGTLIRNNLIHDITKSAYGGWGLYPDEGSSFMLLENNIVYNTNDQGIHEHWGRQNVYRNNIIAYSGGGGITLNREQNNLSVGYPPQGCTFERNIVLAKDIPVFDDTDRYYDTGILYSCLNLYWDEIAGAGTVVWRNRPDKKDYSLDELQAQGLEVHSIIADPMFNNPGGGDFSLKSGSPAYGLGFRPIDMTSVGPRKV